MARFYGISPLHIEKMDFDTFMAYFKAIKVIEAQEMLVSFTISDYPKMKDEGRRSLHRRVHSAAYPEIYEDEKCVSTEEMAMLLGGINGR